MSDAAATKRELRVFALTSAAGFATMVGLIVPYVRRRPFPWWPWGFAAVLIAVGLAMPTALRGVHSLSLRIIHGIGVIQSRIVLTLVFFLVITPLGIALRIVRRRNASNEGASTFRVPSVARDKSSLEKPY
jgi:hypothetical protein